jgi:hypothetical protein
MSSFSTVAQYRHFAETGELPAANVRYDWTPPPLGHQQNPIDLTIEDRCTPTPPTPTPSPISLWRLPSLTPSPSPPPPPSPAEVYIPQTVEHMDHLLDNTTEEEFQQLVARNYPRRGFVQEYQRLYKARKALRQATEALNQSERSLRRLFRTTGFFEHNQGWIERAMDRGNVPVEAGDCKEFPINIDGCDCNTWGCQECSGW